VLQELQELQLLQQAAFAIEVGNANNVNKPTVAKNLFIL
jgi:hypothetical protein